MKKPWLWVPLLCGALGSPAFADNYEWNSGFGMGASEYWVDDGNNNALLVSCPKLYEGEPSMEGYVSAEATIDGQRYGSDTLSGDPGFDVIVDGERWSNPFFTDCRACGSNFPAFWEALRQANNLYISADGVRSKLPTAGLERALPPLDSPENNCRSGW
ncbi:hypothetical protein ACS8E6_05805 [Salinicola halophyticus]|uniref:hypothetical protein n=1 Tax=Salinicola halophyticus TaxID=1808881 RepID=UPI003F4518F6